MTFINPTEVGSGLKKAGRLSSQPLCIYGADTPPSDSTPSIDIDRCIARVIFSLGTQSSYSAIHIGIDNDKQCCPGGQAWFGYQSFRPNLNYFLSTGTPNFREGKSEFLISNPGLATKRLQATGKITPLGKYIVVHRTDQTIEGDPDIKVFLCFGKAEQIRNLCSLVYFDSESSYEAQIPWGPSCASFISYPAGMIENGPENSIIVGPTDPTGNYWFPDDFLSIGIPAEICKKMARNVDSSFIGKRPKIAYPRRKR
jgi:hypothetical protein